MVWYIAERLEVFIQDPEFAKLVAEVHPPSIASWTRFRADDDGRGVGGEIDGKIAERHKTDTSNLQTTYATTLMSASACVSTAT